MLLHMDASFIASSLSLSLFSQEAIFVFVIQIIRTLGKKKSIQAQKKISFKFL